MLPSSINWKWKEGGDLPEIAVKMFYFICITINVVMLHLYQYFSRFILVLSSYLLSLIGCAGTTTNRTVDGTVT